LRVCGKLQKDCYRGSCLLENCKIKAYNKHVEKLESMYINYGKDIESINDLSLSEQIKIVEIDEGTSVLPSVTRTMFEHLKDEKVINKRFNIDNGWMCEVCHGLNIKELEKCGTCGREKGNKIEVNQEEYLEKLRNKYLKHTIRGTKEERLVEKKSLAQQREQERKERIRKRKEQILQEKLAKAAVYDEDDEESDYDSEAEDKRIGDEVSDDDDEVVWHLGKQIRLGELKALKKAEEEAKSLVKKKNKSVIMETLEEINPVTMVKVSAYSTMRDNLDRDTKVGKWIKYLFGSDYTDSVQTTDKRTLLNGGIQWKKSLYQEYEEKANDIEKAKAKKLKKEQRAEQKLKAKQDEGE